MTCPACGYPELIPALRLTRERRKEERKEGRKWFPKPIRPGQDPLSEVDFKKLPLVAKTCPRCFDRSAHVLPATEVLGTWVVFQLCEFPEPKASKVTPYHIPKE